MLELMDERLKASSMAFPSSVLTLRASLCMYLLGLSDLRTRRRGTGVLVEARDLVLREGDGCLVFDRIDDLYDPIDSLPRSDDRLDMFGAAPVSVVLVVAADPRRCRCEKLIPLLPMPPDLAMTGGLLGQCELATEDLEIERAYTDR
jgi:hypothetical protein